jgi:hypothetical protein
MRGRALRVACSNGPTTLVPLARMTSCASATIFAMCRRTRSALSARSRYSIRTLRPTVQPSSASPCANVF